MKYAQIKDGFIKNIIVLDDELMFTIFCENYDYCIRIDELDPQPCILWLYDGSSFSPPLG